MLRLEEFVTVNMLRPVKGNPMGLSELLVYSDLANCDRWEKSVVISQVAWRCGLGRNTVSAVLARLEEQGFLDDGKIVPRSDMFVSRSASGDHWTDVISYWKCLVRSSDTLQVSDQVVWSYLYYHSIVSKWEPPTGWTMAYLSNVLRIARGTVASAIERLQTMDFLRIDGDEWSIADTLLPWQQELFRKKSNNNAGCKLKTFTPDSRGLKSLMANVPTTTVDLNDPNNVTLENFQTKFLQERQQPTESIDTKETFIPHMKHIISKPQPQQIGLVKNQQLKYSTDAEGYPALKAYVASIAKDDFNAKKIREAVVLIDRWYLDIEGVVNGVVEQSRHVAGDTDNAVGNVGSEMPCGTIVTCESPAVE